MGWLADRRSETVKDILEFFASISRDEAIRLYDFFTHPSDLMRDRGSFRDYEKDGTLDGSAPAAKTASG